MSEKATWVSTAGGRIICRRCQAKSKRTQLQCGAPAEVGKRVCRFHGARSNGPKTLNGKLRSAAAHIKTGEYTPSAVNESDRIRALVRTAEYALHALRMTNGPRTRGRLPKLCIPVTQTEEILPALMELSNI